MCRSKLDGGMGFRSFINFNQAFLAKQAWRLLVRPNTLVSQIYKARYFPHNSFFEAPLGHSPSLTWRSIVWGRELLQAGLRWRVGDGNSIRCFLDAWIPSSTFFKTLYSVHYDEELCVSSFITSDRQWDIGKL